MRSKRGSERLNNIIISITIVAAALAIFIAAASDADTEYRYLTDFYTNDLALMVEAVQAVPGDVTIRYPLSTGFEASLQEDVVTVRHVKSGMRQSQPYHLLVGMTIKEGKTKDIVLLTKRGNSISFDKREAIIATSQDCPPLPQKNMYLDVRSKPGVSLSGAAFSKGELTAMADVLNNHLNNLGLQGNQGEYLPLTISSKKPAAGGTITFTRPDAQGAEDQVYQHLYCKLKKGLEGTDLALKEGIGPEINGYEAELVLAFTDEQKASLDQAVFLESIAEAWEHPGKTTGGTP